ncbi:hypothetical protein MmiAt1_02340 [Methanimicrococcus sp. At1]|uniref:MnmG N-terminal domain-containing protein n=1 Tax=Methanimicrococcus hacksteinii TaxID=3028293 RepID=A0ABU3VMZ7_9EURY|nr:NAD(P)/FAD-dependent oxidoreductase [Methanimicrococcus sp. At1]MDV0444699.1 hypothetical protein [Methanimicrococcus sp. At1]
MMEQEELYDMIVVGAGPAGCTAAKFAADAGLNVLLLERMKLPREKSCSGFLIQKSVRFIEQHYGNMPENVFCKPENTSGFILTNEDGKEFRFESPGFNIWRGAFDKWLAEKAEDAGAVVADNSFVTNIAETESKYLNVFLNNGAVFKTKYAVICEGTVGNLKNKITAHQGYKNEKIITYQTFCRGSVRLDPKFFYAFLQAEFSEYDAWVNFKDDLIIFGVAVENAEKIQRYHQKFELFLKSEYGLSVLEIVKEEKWLMPKILPECRKDTVYGRILFAGEAAGFLNPMGEGISSAFITGKAAAYSVKTALEAENMPPARLKEIYEKEIEPEYNYMLRQWKLIGGMSARFFQQL